MDREFICSAPRKENGSSCSNNPNSPVAFKGEFSKATLDVRVAACVISSWNFSSLVGGIRVFLAPVNLRSTYWWSAHSQLPSPSVGFVSAKRLKYVALDSAHSPWRICRS